MTIRPRRREQVRSAHVPSAADGLCVALAVSCSAAVEKPSDAAAHAMAMIVATHHMLATVTTQA